MLNVSIKVKAHNLPQVIERDIERLEQELAYRIVDEARTLIDSSTPRGRLYRRGGIRGRHIKGLRRVSGTKTRGFVGTAIHRASAPGQPPAEDTGRTYQEISVRRMKRGTYRVRFGGAAGYLEFGTFARATRGGAMGPHRGGMLARPYIVPAIEKAVQKVFNGTEL